MADCDLSPIVQQMEYSSRLEFLYKSVEDTQGTIRFLDTKAAFCVTLLSGMVAGVLQKGHGGHGPLFALFIAAVALTLLFCMRVIFPVIKPQAAPVSRPGAEAAEVLCGAAQKPPLGAAYLQQAR